MNYHKDKTVHFAIKGRKAILSIINFRKNGSRGRTGVLTIFNEEDPKKVNPSIEIIGDGVEDIVAEAMDIYAEKCGPVSLEDFRLTEIK